MRFGLLRRRSNRIKSEDLNSQYLSSSKNSLSNIGNNCCLFSLQYLMLSPYFCKVILQYDVQCSEHCAKSLGTSKDIIVSIHLFVVVI